MASRGIRETTVEVTLFKVENTFLAVGNILGEEIVEVVRLQRQEDTTAIGKTRCQDQVQEESTEAAGLGCRRRRGGLRGTCFAISMVTEI